MDDTTPLLVRAVDADTHSLLVPRAPLSPSIRSVELQHGEMPPEQPPRFVMPRVDVFMVTGSVIPKVSVPALGMAVWAAVWATAFVHFGIKEVAIANQLIGILTVVMGLLLVFRTNTAYDRYWEGRRMWGTVITHIRNLARLISTSVQGPATTETFERKHGAVNLLLAFAVATKHHLRNERGIHYDDLRHLLVHVPEYARGATHPWVENLPLEIIRKITQFVQLAKRSDWADVPTTNAMQTAITGLVDCLSNLERIGSSPIPLAYSIHLKQTLNLYLLSLPFQLVSSMGWTTIPVVFVASFTLLGIESIGTEIENPFGYDPNDIKLDRLCRLLGADLREVVARMQSGQGDASQWLTPTETTIDLSR
ncbi:hypothetical protein HK105_202684 [Polyrhizophydium stewartii]|uniref:Uncharacterized protein n=1 Tax=Polyrhizophydium stewartii TaxID=2732419 RepID=A0ABR4NE72_9FUNG|nr:hypothetical protein HK105_007342 [Polyrhizophydium stewartii]